MAPDLLNQLRGAKYIISKLSYYPLSQIIMSNSEGLSVVLFFDDRDIHEYLALREISDPENYEITTVDNFYDFMIEMAEIGYIGAIVFNEFPIYFGNYMSDVDISLPSFAYAKGKIIGAASISEEPLDWLKWCNYETGDALLREFVEYPNGLPFGIKDSLYTICSKISSIDSKPNFQAFHDISNLHGPYTSFYGCFPIFTDEDEANSFLKRFGANAQLQVRKLISVFEFLSSLQVEVGFFDIVLNPTGPRVLQGYFFNTNDHWYLKTVLGTYLIAENDVELIDNYMTVAPIKKDTIDMPNVFDASLRGIRSTIINPLGSLIGTGRGELPYREARQLANQYLDRGYCEREVIKPTDIGADSFLVYAFDKISGDCLSNNSDHVEPLIFDNFVDAITYFQELLKSDYKLRMKGYILCSGDKEVPGSADKPLEDFRLSEQTEGLENIIMKVLSEGYQIEDGELLKSYINRVSVSVEIEKCGYLGDLAVYSGLLQLDELDEEVKDIDKGLTTVNRIKQLSDRFIRRIDTIQLTKTLQDKLRRYLGTSYNNLSIDSKCILESALKQWEAIDSHSNFDFAGISMKLCKVFERELYKLNFVNWRSDIKSEVGKEEIKKLLKNAEENQDLTIIKLLRFLLGKSKLELGAMAHILERLRGDDSHPIIVILSNKITGQSNSTYLHSENIIKDIQLISSKYRNGGVHEKIVSYKLCKEAFGSILMNDNSCLFKLLR